MITHIVRFKQLTGTGCPYRYPPTSREELFPAAT